MNRIATPTSCPSCSPSDKAAPVSHSWWWLYHGTGRLLVRGRGTGDRGGRSGLPAENDLSVLFHQDWDASDLISGPERGEHWGPHAAAPRKRQPSLGSRVGSFLQVYLRGGGGVDLFILNTNATFWVILFDVLE